MLSEGLFINQIKQKQQQSLPRRGNRLATRQGKAGHGRSLSLSLSLSLCLSRQGKELEFRWSRQGKELGQRGRQRAPGWSAGLVGRGKPSSSFSSDESECSILGRLWGSCGVVGHLWGSCSLFNLSCVQIFHLNKEVPGEVPHVNPLLT